VDGINEVLRARFPGTVARVMHQTWRSDALLAADGRVPDDLARRATPAGAYLLTSQLSLSLFSTNADAFVPSIQPDVMAELARHKRDGYLFYPDHWRDWPEVDRRWLREEFAPVGLLNVATSMSTFERIVTRIREGSAAPILVFNLSAVVPGDTVHRHLGLPETLATRIRRFDIGLAELSQRTGISVIDVDAVLERTGAMRAKLDALHFTAEGCRTVEEEIVRVLDDLVGLSMDAAPRCA
jgi:hypothetical protein